MIKADISSVVSSTMGECLVACLACGRVGGGGTAILAIKSSISSDFKCLRAAKLGNTFPPAIAPTALLGKSESASCKSGIVRLVREASSGSCATCCLASLMLPISRSMANSSASRVSLSANGVGGVLTEPAIP